MSGGLLFQRALRLLDEAALPAEASRDVVAVLEAARKSGHGGQVIYELATVAELPRDTLLTRSTGLLLLTAAANVCDDLMDGDVTYLERPVQLAPSAQMLLQALGTAVMLEGGVPARTLAAAQRTFVRAASFSHVEQRTTDWTAARYKLLAEETGGRQWTAYLEMLWAGTPLESHAAAVAFPMACAGYVAEDLRSADRRFTTLTPSEQEDVLAWARAHLAALAESPLRPAQLVHASLAPVLAAGLAR
jgi:hypothetical protein